MTEGMRRMDQRSRRRRPPSRAKQITTVLGVVALLAAAWFGWGLVQTEPEPQDEKTTVVDVEEEEVVEEEEAVVISQRTFVVLGVSGESGSKTLGGALQLVYDPAQNRIGGLFLEPDTFVVISGRGLQSIADGFTEGPKALSAAISEVIGVESEGYLVVDNDEFKKLKETRNVGQLFEQYSDGNVPRAGAKELAAQMNLIPNDRRNLYDVPVRQLEIGESLYYEPVQDELTRLVKAIWGREPQRTENGVRIIILNGNGTPGIGREAADRLVGKGYQIIDVKNADSFDYAATRIMVYTARGKKAGKDLAEDLGIGKVVDDALVQDVADVVIVLGQDFI